MDHDHHAAFPPRRRRPRFDDELDDAAGRTPDQFRRLNLDRLDLDRLDLDLDRLDLDGLDTQLRHPRDVDDRPDLDEGWTTWLDAVHGPEPHPEWVVTELAARDFELGVLKTGKEADVHLLRREVPGTDRSCLLAVKRYRDSRHRMFHRDAGYVEGRRVRRSRETRAMARRTEFGRDLLAGQWAAAEFEALARLWRLGRSGGVCVPYPVQLRGTELMLEFVGDPDGAAAPRLAQLRPDRSTLVDYWLQLVDALGTLASSGLTHGDLSPYNVLVHDDRLVLIDWPQVVDIVGNPLGPGFLARDVRAMSDWFLARGLDRDQVDAARLTAQLLTDAGLPPDAAPPHP